METDIFNEPVSIFENATCTHSNGSATIGQVIAYGKIYRDQVYAIRAEWAQAEQAAARGDAAQCKLHLEQYKRLKLAVPCAIMQGICPTAKNAEMQSYSNVICLDFDAPKPGEADNGNGRVTDWGTIRDDLAQLDYMAYCGLSIGGHGVWCLVPIADHTQHDAAWQWVTQDIARHFGLVVDAATRNIARKRFISYDPDGRENHMARVVEVKSRPRVMAAPPPPRPTYHGRDMFARWVEYCARDIYARHKDITGIYREWLTLCGGIAHSLPQDIGLPLWHAIASQYPGYNKSENEKLYHSMQRDHPTPAGMKSFLRLCMAHGVNVPNDAAQWLQKLQDRTITPWEKYKTQHTTITKRVAAPTSTHCTKAEQYDMEQHAAHIAQGCAIVDGWRARCPEFNDLCESLGVEYYGHGGWNLTNNQWLDLCDQRQLK